MSDQTLRPLAVRKRKFSCWDWIFVKQKLLVEGDIPRSEGAGRAGERGCQGEVPEQLGVRAGGQGQRFRFPGERRSFQSSV